MGKYVIEYATGEYDSWREHIYTMEAESETDIQLWFLVAIEQWKLVSEEYRKLNNDPLLHTDTKKWYEKYNEFITNNSVRNLVVNGYLIYIPDLDYSNPNELDIFTITELDEWFENTKPNRSMKNE